MSIPSWIIASYFLFKFENFHCEVNRPLKLLYLGQFLHHCLVYTINGEKFILLEYVCYGLTEVNESICIKAFAKWIYIPTVKK